MPSDRPDNTLAFEPKQARSRETLDRLLDAAEGALAEAGLDGTTVPAIAERAGMSVGVLYRRFRDKDALLRAVYARFFTRTLALNRDALAPERWAGVGAERILATVVHGMVRGHVQYRGLLRALFTYAQSHPDVEFRRQVEQLNAEAQEQVAALLRERQEELGHPHPTRAVALALFAAAAMLQRWVMGEGDGLHPPADAHEMSEELTRMMLAYLQVRASA